MTKTIIKIVTANEMLGLPLRNIIDQISNPVEICKCRISTILFRIKLIQNDIGTDTVVLQSTKIAILHARLNKIFEKYPLLRDAIIGPFTENIQKRHKKKQLWCVKLELMRGKRWSMRLKMEEMKLPCKNVNYSNFAI